jgi:acyl-ACP thioesterase
MNTERECIYEVETEVADLNEQKLLKPYAYQKLFSQVVEKHLNEHNSNVETTMKNKLAWALASISFEMVKPIQGCIKMFASTWYSRRKGPYFRREIMFKDENEGVVFKGSSFSILLDIEKRTVYRRKETPFNLFEPVEVFTTEAKPTYKTTVEYNKVGTREVYNSYIDCIGHVNNSRYGEFAYDTFTDQERDNLLSLKRIEVYFLYELRNKDIFSILKTRADDHIMIRGYNETRNNIAFDMIFEF